MKAESDVICRVRVGVRAIASAAAAGERACVSLRWGVFIVNPPVSPIATQVLWRQKEQFSDGVGYDWVDGLKAYARTVVTDEMWDKRHERFPVDTPRSREYYLLRQAREGGEGGWSCDCTPS